MNRLPTKPNQTLTPLFNPSLDNFIFIYDKQEYTLNAYAIETFPKYIADRLARKLADHIISKSGVKENYELDKINILNKIYVNEH